MEKSKFTMVFAGTFVFEKKDKNGKKNGQFCTAVKFLIVDEQKNDIDIKVYYMDGKHDLSAFKIKQKVSAIFEPPTTPEGKMHLVSVAAVEQPQEV